MITKMTPFTGSEISLPWQCARDWSEGPLKSDFQVNLLSTGGKNCLPPAQKENPDNGEHVNNNNYCY